MTKRCIVFLLFSTVAGAVLAQNEVDALRYSYNQGPVSARSQGMGGAFGALGADLSSFFSNPAGLGLYKRDGMEIGIGIVADQAEASYEGTISDAQRERFYLQSAGLINVGEKKYENWSYTLGIAHTKLNSYNQEINIRGSVQDRTLLDVFANQANGIPYNEVASVLPFGAGLAWNTYLIDPLNESQLTYVAAAGSGQVNQSKIVERRGFSSETAVGGGLAFKDFLYLGATVGFNTINFTEESSYGESFSEANGVANFSFTENLSADGIGINARLGALVRATNWLRAGVFYQSPSRIRLSERYFTNMNAIFRNAPSENWSSPTNDFNYSVTTPGRAGVNLAFILGESGVVAADYEFSDYGAMRMAAIQSSDYGFELENETIGLIYRVAHRFRAGTELRMARYFRARVGAAYEQSPFVNGVNSNSPRITYTGGGGYRKDFLSLDFAVAYSEESIQNWMYDPQFVNPATIDMSRWNILLALGIRF